MTFSTHGYDLYSDFPYCDELQCFFSTYDTLLIPFLSKHKQILLLKLPSITLVIMSGITTEISCVLISDLGNNTVAWTNSVGIQQD